ncbi:unnamed protein product [Caenorhabditis angaria]|uniref:Uncharacterized protein n=1 Tax=Caenorhabditis angaria TaxID=860376 RepID=A0A9P1IVX8_9PELO|nr:unnamed protein product [Caenorhabditis angaria]
MRDKILLFLLFFYFVDSATDPLESIIRNGWLMIRDYGEKMISKIAIPQTMDLPQDIVAFQTDSKTLNTLSQMINTCPQSVPVSDLSGIWHITHVSKRFQQTVIFDINEAIEKLASGKSLNSRKSLFTLFKAEPTMRCLQFNVLNNSPSSPVEFSYLSSSRRSIIGNLDRPTATQTTINLANTIEIPFTILFHTTTNTNNKVVIFAQTDTLPTSCDNLLVLQSNPNGSWEGSDVILSSYSTSTNPIVKLNYCNEQQRSGPIIRPASQKRSWK